MAIDETKRSEERLKKLWEIWLKAKKVTDDVAIEAGELHWLLKIAETSISMVKRFPEGPKLDNLRGILDELSKGLLKKKEIVSDDVRRLEMELWMTLRAHGKPVAFRIDDIPDDFIVSKMFDSDKEEVTLTAHSRDELPDMIAEAKQKGIHVIKVERE